MNPRIIKLIAIGYDNKVKEIDYLAWMFGQYIESAVFSSVQASLHGKKSNAKYVEKPFLMQAEINQKAEADRLTEAEKQKQVELLFMRLQVQAHNFKQEQKKKQKEQDGIGA